MADVMNPELIIQVDGGVNGDNIADLKAAGCNAVVAGNYVFSCSDYKKSYR